MSITVSRRALPALVVALGFASAASFALEQYLVDRAGDLQRDSGPLGRDGAVLGPAFVHALPFPVVDPGFGPPTSIRLTLLGVALLQSGVLYALYRALRERVPTGYERAGLVVAAVVMLLTALHARTLLGFDAYAYAGYAKLGVAASYAPPAAPFPGAFGAINAVWGAPMPLSYYGPLWMLIDRLVAGGAATLGDAIRALRWVEAGAFVAIVAALAQRRAGAAALALFALNPAVHALYVANAHNDLFGVAFLMVALALAARAPLAAAVCVALAGLVKLPLTAAALVVFAGRGGVRRRIGWVAVAVALTVAGSLVLGGGDYVHALLFRLHDGTTRRGLNVLTAAVIKLGLIAVAACALVTVFARGRVWRSAGWSFIATSSLVYSWYLAWALPYAALECGALVAYLVLLPLAAAALESAFPHLGLGQAAMLVMLAAGAFEIVRRRSRAIEHGSGEARTRAQTIRPGP